MSKELSITLEDGNGVQLDADTWHIDDRGQLHVSKGKEPVASFARDRWVAVEVVDGEPLR